jgi:hypothetical protein
MAKILRTEQLSVDGDNIRLTADQGNLIINSVSGDDLVQITSTTKIGQDISSLAVRDTGFDTDVSSLAAGTSSVESMLVNVSKYGVYSLETSNLSTGAGSSVQTITLAGRAFVAKPTVTATLTGSENDPIIAVMISDVSETATTGVYQVTFQFSDELPTTGGTDQATNYKLNILANVNVADQDLDAIVDSVDSDRDGDGAANSLDYDPDDSSVASFSDTLKPSCDQVVLHLQPAAGETIADKSSNQHTVTTVGDAVTDNTATLFGGGTMNFDGNGDYLSIGDTSTFKFLHDGTTDYTVECWWSTSNISNIDIEPIISSAGYSETIGFTSYYTPSSQQLRAIISANSTSFIRDARLYNWAPELNRWYHIAITFDSTTSVLSLFLDGVRVAQSDETSSLSTFDSNTPLKIGAIYDSAGHSDRDNWYYHNGSIQDVRISKKAVYAANFTPPTNLLNNPC